MVLTVITRIHSSGGMCSKGVGASSEARAALLLKQLPHQWNALREVIAIRCESVNNKARRTVLRVAAPDNSRLEIRREDDQLIVLQFEPEKKKVTFSGKALGFDR